MTLILSSSDFLIEDNDGGTTWTSISGTAVLHSDVTNDVSYDSGSIASSSYCRRYDPNGGTNLLYTTISSSVDGGTYIGPFGDNAISVRVWIYVDNIGANHRTSLVIKNGQALLGSGNREGYFLELDVNRLYLGVQSGSTAVDRDQILTNQFASETWYRIRLDYIPVGTIKDVLNAYTASAGGTGTETWELVGTKTILSSDPNYITASAATRIGYVTGQTSVKHIDDFDVYVTPVG